MARSSTTFGPGNNANPAGRPPKTAAIRKAEKALRKGAPRAVERLMELMESADEQVAIAAVKVALSKVMPDMKQTEHSGTVKHEDSGLNADERREAIKRLREEVAAQVAH